MQRTCTLKQFFCILYYHLSQVQSKIVPFTVKFSVVERNVGPPCAKATELTRKFLMTHEKTSIPRLPCRMWRKLGTGRPRVNQGTHTSQHSPQTIFPWAGHRTGNRMKKTRDCYTWFSKQKKSPCLESAMRGKSGLYPLKPQIIY